MSSAGRAENTVRAYAYDLLLFFRYLTHIGRSWTEISIDDTGAFLAWLQFPDACESIVSIVPSEARVRSTRDRALSTVFAFYDFHIGAGARVSQQLAAYQGSRSRNTVARSKANERRSRPIRVTRRQRLPEAVEHDDAEKLLRACTTLRDRLLLALWWVSGLRIGQSLGIRHEDFDGRRRQVRIVRRQNANNAWAKNKDEKVIPITPEVVALHREYMFEEYGDLDSDYLFVVLRGPTRGQAMTASAAYSVVASLKRRTQVRYTPHMLRHAFATDFVERGGRLEALSEFLTHSSVSSTEIYVHLSPKHLREELERVTR